MKARLAVIALLVSCRTPAFAHRLDEYLQAIIVSVGQHHIQASMRLVPGVAVSAAVIAAVDTNGDNVLSQTEQQTYTERVLHDLSLTIDGHGLTPRLRSVNFPTTAEMKEGIGEIHIEFVADLPAGEPQRTLVIENHHQSAVSAYLMNCLAPQDPNIGIISQNRNQNQSYYRIGYTQSGPQQASSPLLANLGGLLGMFRLGMRHIAEGTDHLLFLIALLLPAPLLAVRSHWAGPVGVRRSLIQILRVVTAFTVGHSITLAFAASGLVNMPSRPVEVLIAFPFWSPPPTLCVHSSQDAKR